jgi:isoleucyl-tRNA synthetase
LRELRGEVTKQLEEVRVAGGIGSSLQAEIEIKASGDKYALLTSLGDDLKFVFITSQATVTQVGSEAEEAVIVTPSAHAKCERCWHYRADVGSHPEHPGICGRCVSNLFGKGEARKFA